MHTYTIHIHDSLQKRLAERAAEEQKPIEQIIVDFLDEYMPDLDAATSDYDPSRDILLLLAKAAEEEGWSAEEDLSERTREILWRRYDE